MKFIEKFLPINDTSLNLFDSHSEDIKEWINVGVKYVRYVVNEENPKIPIHFSGTSINEKSNGRLLYGELFNRIANKSSQNVTILNSLYNRVPGEEIIRIINQPIHTTKKYLSELLADSNGYMIYHHQLESFISDLMGYSKEDAKRLRRSWNKKVIGDREVLITNENYWLIETRMPLYFTFKNQVQNEQKNS